MKSETLVIFLECAFLLEMMILFGSHFYAEYQSGQKQEKYRCKVEEERNAYIHSLQKESKSFIDEDNAYMYEK